MRNAIKMRGQTNGLCKDRIMLMMIVIAFIAVLSIAVAASSDDADAAVSFTSDGINYEVISGTDVRVVAGDYHDSVTIPQSVEHSGKTYSVTAIGECAFESQKDLYSVTIPATVVSIGDRAFYSCNNVVYYSVADGNPNYRSVGGVLFSKDTLIQYPVGSVASSYAVPDGITAIGKEAFLGAPVLKEIIIGNGVSAIGDDAFCYCPNVDKFTVAEDNSYFTSVDGVLFNKEKTKLIAYPAMGKAQTYTVPDTVISICGYAFCKTAYLETIVIGSNVSSISETAFYYCLILSGIEVDPENVNFSSADGVLFSKDKTQLIYCPLAKGGNAYTIPDTVVTVCNYSFYGLAMSELTISDSVRTIGDHAFHASMLNSIIIPDGVTTIGSEAFCNCIRLTDITIGSGVTSIGKDAFLYDNDLASITVALGNTVYGSDDGVLFSKDMKTLLRYPAAKTGYSYTVPSTVTAIGDEAFNRCNNLVSVTITDNVVTIGDSAFRGCSALVTVTIGNCVISIGNSAFAYCRALNSLTIGDHVQSIGDMAFFNTRLENVTVPASVTSIGNSAFCQSSALISVTVDSGNQNYRSENGVLFTKDMTDLIVYPASKTDTSYSVPGTVKTIGNYAFCKCTNLISLTIPNGVVSIGSGAFSECTNLTSVSLPASTASVGYNAFYDCRAVASYTVDSGNQNFCSENGVLFTKDMTVLIAYPASKTDTSYVIPGVVRYIGDYALFRSTNLTSVTMPNGLISIGSYAFALSGLESLNVPAGAESVGRYAFKHCFSLETATFTGSIKYMAPNAFDGAGFSTVFMHGKEAASIGFDTFLTHVAIYVPYESIDEYRIKWAYLTNYLRPAAEIPAVNEFVYNGQEQTAVESKQGGYSATGNKATDAGNYVATLTLADGVYWFDTTTSAKDIPWSISHKQVIVKADDASKRHGNQDPKLTATVTGLIGDDSIVYTLSRAEGEDVGKYTITASGGSVQGNYAVTYENGTFTVKEDLSAVSSVLWAIPAVLFVIMICALVYASVRKD